MGSPLYQRQIVPCQNELIRRVWDPTPWMVDAYTGSCSEERYQELAEWCREQFGPEASPIHGLSGTWQRGGATVFGWTWIGFATEAQLQQFLTRWEETFPPYPGGSS